MGSIRRSSTLVACRALAICLVALAGAFLPAEPAQAATVPRGLTLMLTGDSVSESIQDALDARARATWGWRVVDAAVPACSLMGEPLAWPDGTYKTLGGRCDIVVPTQDAVLADHAPEVVIWWDRLSQMPYMTRTDPATFVRSGTDLFWALRHAELRARAAHFAEGGARIVFVATEPMGIGVYKRCITWDETRACAEWVRYRMRLYEDVTRRWNRMLRTYARHHPATAVYISITPDICHSDVSPCDDRIDGIPARPDGTHYENAGETKAARVLIHKIRLALFPPT